MSVIINEVNRREKVHQETMRQYRALYMEDVIAEVVAEQYHDDITDTLKDYVDTAVANEGNDRFFYKGNRFGYKFET